MAQRGIYVEDSSQLYVRNNFVLGSGEWGIQFDNGNLPVAPTDNVVAFNTVRGSGTLSPAGALFLTSTVAEVRDNVLAGNQTRAVKLDTAGTRLHLGAAVVAARRVHVVRRRAGGHRGDAARGGRAGVESEVRDNVIVSNAATGLRLDAAGSFVKNNLLFGSATPLSPADYPLGGGMLAVDPLLVDPDGADGVLGGISGWADDLFALAHVAAGQGADSPAVNAGSGNASALDIGGSTRSDAVDGRRRERTRRGRIPRQRDVNRFLDLTVCHAPGRGVLSTSCLGARSDGSAGDTIGEGGGASSVETAPPPFRRIGCSDRLQCSGRLPDRPPTVSRVSRHRATYPEITPAAALMGAFEPLVTHVPTPLPDGAPTKVPAGLSSGFRTAPGFGVLTSS